MSSAAAVVDWQAVVQPELGRAHGPFSEHDIYPVPPQSYESKTEAYWASKSAALHAAKEWIQKEKPEFQIIHIMPSFVLGRDLRARSTDELLLSTNGLLLGPLLGAKSPVPIPGLTVDVQDVARVSLECLANKVEGNEDFLLSSHTRDGVKWEDGFDLVRSKYPQSIDAGIFLLTGSQPTHPYIQLNTSKAKSTFGELSNFDKMADDVIGQFVNLAMAGRKSLANSKS
jgi:nucleoside-diphosphate-sugar epimerase